MISRRRIVARCMRDSIRFGLKLNGRNRTSIVRRAGFFFLFFFSFVFITGFEEWNGNGMSVFSIEGFSFV